MINNNYQNFKKCLSNNYQNN